MSKSMKNMVLLAKTEVAPGTDPTPTGAANAILCRALTPSIIEAEFVERAVLRGYKGNFGQLAVNVHRMFEFEIELAGSGAAGTAPKWGPVLKACGFSETVTASVETEYAPVSTGGSTVTLYGYLDGILFKLTNGIGTVVFDLNAKGIPVMRFRFIGVYTALTEPGNATPTFTGFQQPLTVGKVNTPTFTFMGQTLCMQQFSVDLANVLIYRDLVNCSGPHQPDRKPSGTTQVELPPVATLNFGEIVRLGTTGAAQIVHGTTAGNIVTIDMPKIQVNAKPTIGNDNDIAMLTAPFSVQPNAGNDEITITCT